MGEINTESLLGVQCSSIFRCDKYVQCRIKACRAEFTGLYSTIPREKIRIKTQNERVFFLHIYVYIYRKMEEEETSACENCFTYYSHGDLVALCLQTGGKLGVLNAESKHFI